MGVRASGPRAPAMLAFGSSVCAKQPSLRTGLGAAWVGGATDRCAATARARASPPAPRCLGTGSSTASSRYQLCAAAPRPSTAPRARCHPACPQRPPPPQRCRPGHAAEHPSRTAQRAVQLDRYLLHEDATHPPSATALSAPRRGSGQVPARVAAHCRESLGPRARPPAKAPGAPRDAWRSSSLRVPLSVYPWARAVARPCCAETGRKKLNPTGKGSPLCTWKELHESRLGHFPETHHF